MTKEIFENFDFSKYKIKKALDLGCSPGGWSRLLLERGYGVVGIDPALVDERVLKNQNFSHFKGTSEDFVLKNTEKYDLICNDMKMDFKNSIAIINSLKPFLNDGRLVILTVKLYNNDIAKISEIMSRLKENYKILFARQFYNNRSEFSIILEKK